MILRDQVMLKHCCCHFVTAIKERLVSCFAYLHLFYNTDDKQNGNSRDPTEYPDYVLSSINIGQLQRQSKLGMLYYPVRGSRQDSAGGETRSGTASVAPVSRQQRSHERLRGHREVTHQQKRRTGWGGTQNYARAMAENGIGSTGCPCRESLFPLDDLEML